MVASVYLSAEEEEDKEGSLRMQGGAGAAVRDHSGAAAPGASPPLEEKEEEAAATPATKKEEEEEEEEVSWPPRPLSRESCSRFYTKCYCEENVYHLNDALVHGCLGGPPPSSCRVFAVVISNAAKCVPIWHQRAARQPGEPVLWDYHVITLVLPLGGVGGGLVYDLDTCLHPFPCPAPTYFQAAFHPPPPTTPGGGGTNINDMISAATHHLPPQYQQLFRVVPFEDYRDFFASDRSHMRRPGGGWSSPPPSCPPIRGRRAWSAMTLPHLWDMTTSDGGGRESVGTIMTTAEFGQLCGGGGGGGGLDLPTPTTTTTTTTATGTINHHDHHDEGSSRSDNDED